MVPQPPQPDNKAIAATWKVLTEEYEAKRAAYILDLETKIEEGEIDADDADHLLESFEHKHKPRIDGVQVKQSVGIRYR
jgi:hypothetical protein